MMKAAGKIRLNHYFYVPFTPFFHSHIY